MSLSHRYLRQILGIILVLSCFAYHGLCTNQDFDEDADDDYTGEGPSVLILEHSFDQDLKPMFKRRGQITIRSIKSGLAHFSQEGLALDVQDKENLKELASSDGLYRLRLGSKSAGGGPMQYVSSFVKACSIYESKLSDLLTINVDTSGNVIGISATTTSPYCFGMAVDNKDLDNFNTTVEIVQTVPGPSPDTQSYIHKLEAEKMEKEKGAQSDNRSFIAKYWMYLVPLFIFLMFANSMDPSGGGGGGR